MWGCRVHTFSASHTSPHFQELLEYMRKLEAHLEKVADEKWSEDPATEDEEAAVGLSLYTHSLVTPPPNSPSPCDPLGAASALRVLPSSFPDPSPRFVNYIFPPEKPELIQPSFFSACSLACRLPSSSDRLGGRVSRRHEAPTLQPV